MRLHEIDSLKRKQKIVRHFTDWAIKTLGIDGTPKVKITNDKKQVESHRTFGTTNPAGEIWVYMGDRNTADVLRTLCHELVHFKQFEKGTAHDSMNNEENQRIEDEANALAGRMLRTYGKKHLEIYEARQGSLLPDVAAALPATYALPELKNQDPYLQYRFGVAIASAKGAEQRKKDDVPDFYSQSAWGENQIVVSADPNIETWIDDALHQMGLHGKKLISTKDSIEAPDVDHKSPVTSFKGYPR